MGAIKTYIDAVTADLADVVVDGISFPGDAHMYYNTQLAANLINKIQTEKPDGIEIWRCVLCGWPIGLNAAQREIAGACCCGGCGMTCLRPIEEYR